MESHPPGLPGPVIEAAVACLRAEPGIGAAFLHGSAAKAGLRTDSDIDIALLPAAGVELGLDARLDLAGRLEGIFQRTVDLGILSSRNVVYAKEVAAHGRLLFTRDRLASDRFMAQALSMYADLQRNRKVVLDAYAA